MKLATFDAICIALNDAGVRFLVAGGLAVNAHGYLRLTYDVDLVVQLDRENIQALANRPKDLDDIDHLRSIAKEKRRDQYGRE